MQGSILCLRDYSSGSKRLLSGPFPPHLSRRIRVFQDTEGSNDFTRWFAVLPLVCAPFRVT